MRIATAFYDKNDTLVTPYDIAPPLFETPEPTMDVGYWHRYMDTFGSKQERVEAYKELRDRLRDYDAIPYQLHTETLYPGNDARYVAQCRENGITPPTPGVPHYRLEIFYVIEAPDKTPYYRKEGEAHIDESFAFPDDPVVDDFCYIYEVEPLNFQAQLDRWHKEREKKVSDHNMNVHTQYAYHPSNTLGANRSPLTPVPTDRDGNKITRANTNQNRVRFNAPAATQTAQKKEPVRLTLGF